MFPKCKNKCGRLNYSIKRIEFMEKVNHKKILFYQAIWISLFLLTVGEGLSQPAPEGEKAPKIKLGEVTVKSREFQSTPPLKILEIQIEVLNQSQQSAAPPDSIKVVVTPKEIQPAGKSPLTPEESVLNFPLPPKTGRVMIIGYPFPEETPESITFEVQINPPEGEKKTVIWEWQKTP
jgi:hypothetical protein